MAQGTDGQNVPGEHMCIGRVLHEDDALMTIEVVKDQTRKLRLEDGDRFLTFIFVKQVGGSTQAETWLPWEG